MVTVIEVCVTQAQLAAGGAVSREVAVNYQTSERASDIDVQHVSPSPHCPII